MGYSQTNKLLKTLLTAILPLLGSFFGMTRNLDTIFILFLPNKRDSSKESHRNNLFHCFIVIPLYLPLIMLFLFQVLHPTFISLPFLKKFFFNCPVKVHCLFYTFFYLYFSINTETCSK